MQNQLFGCQIKILKKFCKSHVCTVFDICPLILTRHYWEKPRYITSHLQPELKWAKKLIFSCPDDLISACLHFPVYISEKECDGVSFPLTLPCCVTLCHQVSDLMFFIINCFRSVFNYFIISLAVSDLISALISPLFVYRRVWGTKQWQLSSFVCKVGIDISKLFVYAIEGIISDIFIFAGNVTRYTKLQPRSRRSVVQNLKRTLHATWFVKTVVFYFYFHFKVQFALVSLTSISSSCQKTLDHFSVSQNTLRLFCN